MSSAFSPTPRPVAVRVFPGNTGDPGAFTTIVDVVRMPVGRQWSRKHADTQRDLCARHLGSVIGTLTCQDIRVTDMQAAVNAAPAAGEGKRVRAMISALVNAGIAGGYLASARLKDVHWQANGRAVREPYSQVAGESGRYVDPDEIPAAGDVVSLGQAVGAHHWLCELMVNFAAYTGSCGR
jgi:hypothetical protein